MLSKRWEEEVMQTKREMIAFVQYFQKLRVNLMNDLAIKQTVVQSYLEVCVEMSENKVINYCCFSIFATFQFIKLKKISDFSISRSQETRASIVLLTEEIERVKMILASATNRFQGHFVADDEENSEEEEENEEDEESLEILPIDYDSEIEYNEL
jgi:hypothetical protein